MSIKKELANLDEVPDEFINAVEKENKKVFDAVFKLLTELDQVDGNISPTAANLQRIQLITNALSDALFDGGYLDAVKKYVKEFESHGEIIKDVFKKNFQVKENPLYQEVIKNAQRNTLKLFDEAAIENVLATPVRDILTQSITTGMKFSDMTKNIKDFIEGSSEVDGRLVKYAKTYAHDSFTIFDRSFTQAVNKDVDVQFWEYAGNEIRDTREFCRDRVGKVYSNEEIKSWAAEDWQGKNPNTTEDTIFNYLGGYNCRHTLLPVSEDRFKEIMK